MGLSDTSKDAHLNDDFKNMKQNETLINRINRSRVMAETPALVVKTWFWFLDPKSVNFQHFRRRKKAPYSTASYFFCI